jgi:hypothetical protein
MEDLALKKNYDMANHWPRRKEYLEIFFGNQALYI